MNIDKIIAILELIKLILPIIQQIIDLLDEDKKETAKNIVAKEVGNIVAKNLV